LLYFGVQIYKNKELKAKMIKPPSSPSKDIGEREIEEG
jgi:hypothetical protein